MRTRSHRNTAVVVAFALLLCLGTAQGATLGVLQVDEAHFQSIDGDGRSHFTWLQGTGARTGPVNLTLEAAQLSGTHFESRFLVVPGVREATPNGLEAPVPWQDRIEEPFQASNAHLDLAAIDPQFAIAIRSVVPLGLEAQTAGLHAKPLQGARLSHAGIGPSQEPVPSGADEGDYFQPVQIDRPVVFAEATNQGFRVSLRGDMTIEIIGLDLTLHAEGSEARTLSGRPYYESIEEDGPAIVDQVAHVAVHQFLRIDLRDATLTFETPYLDGLMQWAASELVVFPAGRSTFLNATGTLEGPQGDQQLHEERYTTNDQPVVRMESLGGQLAIRLEPVGPETSRPVLPAGMVVGIPGAVFAVVSTLSVAVTIGVLTVWAWRRGRRIWQGPTLADIEGSLAAGKYLVGARKARRFVRRDPENEAGWVALAVALSKGDRHAEVVRLVEPRLAAAPPSDGTLHYVVGLAYLGLGRRKDAERRLRQAVDRTPALGTDVARYLASPRPATNGYT